MPTASHLHSQKAISGIGSEIFVDIGVDNEARMNVNYLRTKFDKCIKKETPIFGVVAIMGSRALAGLLKPDTASKLKLRLDKGIPAVEKPLPPVEKGFTLRNVWLVVDESIAFAALDGDYTAKMPFYLYGSKNECSQDGAERAD